MNKALSKRIRTQKKNLFSAALLLAALLTVPAQAQLTEPETKVSISIYDLVKGSKKKVKKENAAVIEKTYIDAFLKVIYQNKKALADCLVNESKTTSDYKFTVAASGEAVIERTDGVAADSIEFCQIEILKNLKYPKHVYQSIEINVPLTFNRLVL